MLVQQYDQFTLDHSNVSVPTKREPSEEEWKALKLGWKVVKHVKSNAIVVNNADMTLGIGAGQMNRVGALEAVAIGTVTDDKMLRLIHNGEIVANVPADALAEEAPVYHKPSREPEYYREFQAMENEIPAVADYKETLIKLLQQPTIASKEWVYDQYDYMVRTNTVVAPGSDAAVIRIRGTRKGLAMTTDCNARYMYLDPETGGKIAVAEAARNIVCSGGEPLAITDNLNFGNPEQEKAAIQNAGLAVAPYGVIETVEDIYDNIEKFGLPAVLKTSRGGYDGKGQYVIRSKEEVNEARQLLIQGKCVLEKWIPFEKEISVIICRNSKGEIAVFPVGENIHRENILHQTIVPARITRHVEEQAVQAAEQLAENLGLVGTLAVEMFLTEDGQI